MLLFLHGLFKLPRQHPLDCDRFDFFSDFFLFEKIIEPRTTVVRSFTILPHVHGSPLVSSDMVCSHQRNFAVKIRLRLRMELEVHAADRSDALQHRERTTGIFGIFKTGAITDCVVPTFLASSV